MNAKVFLSAPSFEDSSFSIKNLEKIKKMGMFWWSEFGDRAIKFLDSN